MLKKHEIISIIAYDTGLTNKAVEKVLADLVILIASELTGIGGFVLPNLGTFKVIKTAERNGVNPKTGERITIAAGRRVKFQINAAIKRELQW